MPGPTVILSGPLGPLVQAVTGIGRESVIESDESRYVRGYWKTAGI
jgi:hypothetical protein